MTDLLCSLRELFRLHPLPWRDNGIGYTDHNGHAVGFGLRVLAEHGFDIVSLAEQCAELGAPSELVDFAADAEGRESKALDRAYEAEEERDDLKRELEDAESEIDRLKDDIESLEQREKTSAYVLSVTENARDDYKAALDVLVSEMEDLREMLTHAEGVIERQKEAIERLS